MVTTILVLNKRPEPKFVAAGLLLILHIYGGSAAEKNIKKPPPPIRFDTYETDTQNGYPNYHIPKSGYIFPPPKLKLLLARSRGLASTTPTPFTSPPNFFLSPEEVMLGTISDLTHGAFSSPLPKLEPLSSSGAGKRSKATAPPHGIRTTPKPNLFTTTSGGPSIKVGGHTSKTSTKPMPPPVKHDKRELQIQVAETENRGMVTAEDLSGNRPTLTPFHFPATSPPTTPAPTTTVPPPPLPPTTYRGRGHRPRHREGKKVPSPHNHVFAPTQNPIGIAHNEAADLVHDDFSKFRAALSEFGSRFDEPRTIAPAPTEPPQTLPPPPPTTTQHAIIIQRAKIIPPPGVNSKAPSKKLLENQDHEEELPFFTEPGGVFEQHAPEREGRRGNLYLNDLAPGPIEYKSKRQPAGGHLRPSPVDYARHSYGPRPDIDYIPAVTYRPIPALTSHDPRNHELPRNYLQGHPHDNYDGGHRHPSGFPQNRNQNYRQFQNAPGHKPNQPSTAEVYHFGYPNDPEPRRPKPTPPRNILFDNYETHDQHPYTTTTTERTIHFAQKPPDRLDPASDYFYGDPRPPPPTPPPKPKPADVDEKEEEEEEDEDEEQPEDDEEEDEEPQEKKAPKQDEEEERDEESDENGRENERPQPQLHLVGRNPTQDGRNDHHDGGNNYFRPTPPANNFYPPNPHPQHRNQYSAPAQNGPGGDFKPFRPSRPFPPQPRPPPNQAGFGFENSNGPVGRGSHGGGGGGRRPNYSARSPGRIGEFTGPPPSNLDPIYTMSIQDYDAELKRRENRGRHPPAQNQQYPPSRHKSFEPAEHSGRPRLTGSGPGRPHNQNTKNENEHRDDVSGPPGDYDNDHEVNDKGNEGYDEDGEPQRPLQENQEEGDHDSEYHK